MQIKWRIFFVTNINLFESTCVPMQYVLASHWKLLISEWRNREDPPVIWDISQDVMPLNRLYQHIRQELMAGRFYKHIDRFYLVIWCFIINDSLRKTNTRFQHTFFNSRGKMFPFHPKSSIEAQTVFLIFFFNVTQPK